VDYLPSPWIASTRLLHRMRAGVEVEEQCLRITRDVSRNQVSRLLTEQAEHNGWELARLRRYRDGSREVWLRRKVIRARLTVMA
jgi:hypothetical protein